VAVYSVEERQRLLAKPGLTCFWQVGGRSNIDFAGQVRLDLAYIQSESFWLDLKLLVQTVPAVLFGKGAF
jgi:lipopolysaccharide/colanic/teichoic acid biosynthesis glycosyltransferase